MVTAEVIPPLLFVEEANAPDEPDSDSVEKQEEQMGIFQTLDRLEKVVDALLNTKFLHLATKFESAEYQEINKLYHMHKIICKVSESENSYESSHW